MTPTINLTAQRVGEEEQKKSVTFANDTNANNTNAINGRQKENKWQYYENVPNSTKHSYTVIQTYDLIQISSSSSSRSILWNFLGTVSMIASQHMNKKDSMMTIKNPSKNSNSRFQKGLT